MTPYAQMLAVQMRPEAQATFAYEYQRYAKDPTLAFVLTLVLGVVGGESYYLGNYIRGILMSLALFTRHRTVRHRSDVDLPLLHDPGRMRRIQRLRRLLASAALLALRNPHDQQPPEPPLPPEPSRARYNIGGLPMAVRR